MDAFDLKYNGQSNVGVNSEDSGECTGLFAVFLRDNGAAFEWGNAKDLFANADPKIFQKIVNNPNDPNQLPQNSDWLIFGAAPWNGYNGHIVRIITAAVRVFTSLEQNNPAGYHVVHQVTHATANPYAGAIGWLRYMPGHSTTPPSSGWAHANVPTNVRTAPHLNAPVVYVLQPNSTFGYKAIVQGDSVNGSNLWVESNAGHFLFRNNITLGA